MHQLLRYKYLSINYEKSLFILSLPGLKLNLKKLADSVPKKVKAPANEEPLPFTIINE
ncbi:hypothetical protein GCM10027443_14910 [Pontibacter brevis]